METSDLVISDVVLIYRESDAKTTMVLFLNLLVSDAILKCFDCLNLQRLESFKYSNTNMQEYRNISTSCPWCVR